MSDVSKILNLLDEALKLEKKIETAIASEKDVKRREKIEKAFKDKNLTADQRRALIADLLYNP
jgi:hypothetical protein